MHILDHIWPFWAKIPNTYGRKQKLWYPSNGKTIDAACSHCFLVRHWIKWAKNANIWLKKLVLGQIWPLWTKNPNSYGRKQKFWYPQNRKTNYTPCLHRFLVGHGTKWAKMPTFGEKKSQFCAKFGRLWAKNPNFNGRSSKSLGTHITENHLGTLFELFFGRALDRMGRK